MAFSHTIGGTTFTQANFEGNAYSDEATGFPKAMEKMAEHVANAYRGISTTSNAVGTGSKTWTVTNSNSQIPAFAVGMPVRVARTSAPTTTYMQGEITAFTASTGSTTVNVSSSLGSGTHTDWTIVIGGHQTTAAASPLGIAAGGTGGGTAAAARTALGIADDSASAYAGVLESNAGFVDQCLLGPAVDGRSWNGLWDKAGVFSSLMLATISDEGSSTRVRIWDLTEETAGVISTTQLASVDLSAAATPTCVAAIMGYVFIGSEDGYAVVDCHSNNVWAERTQGWPKTTSTSTRPTIAANTVIDIGLGYQSNPPYDPRTGGYLPTVAAALSGGSQTFSIIKYGTPSGEDPTGYWLAGTGHSAAVSDNRLFANVASVLKVATNIDTIVANSPSMVEVAQAGSANNLGFAADVDNGLSVVGNDLAYASSTGFTRVILNENAVATGTGILPLNALINRTYNTGFLASVSKGVWLSNSKTADRGAFSNTLTEAGTVTEGPASGSGGTASELLAYSGWSASNKLTRASDADWDTISTGSIYMSVWVKSSGTSGYESLFGWENAGSTVRCVVQISTDGQANWWLRGASSAINFTTTLAGLDDGGWHKFDFVQIADANRLIYVDGVLAGSNTATIGSLSDGGNLPFCIGEYAGGSYTGPATSSTLALAHLSTTVPTATQIRQAYDGEKGMFVASAECLLQSGSTDAVLDVDVDPLSGKVIVTQTDSISIWDGLAISSKPAVNSGSSEKGKLFGEIRSEQNSANSFVTAPATDQRQTNLMVQALAAGVPKGVDLSKAKAWVNYNHNTPAINGSYNVKSVTDVSTGRFYVNFSVPFKNNDYAAIGTSRAASGQDENLFVEAMYKTYADVRVINDGGSGQDSTLVSVLFFGELENE